MRKYVTYSMLTVTIGVLSGCSSLQEQIGIDSTTASNIVAQMASALTGEVQRAAVCFGLTAVDPDDYDGWGGECPGSDIDAQVFALLCRENGISNTSEYYNDEVTISGFKQAVRDAVADLKPGDLLVIFSSGHGGQIADTNGDEDDDMDETLCLWDGQLSDDDLYALLLELPIGLRVFFVTDTCNSGSNFKARPIRMHFPVARELAPFALIHYGGCADGKSSYGSASGGAWTTALVDGWVQGVSYSQWFKDSKATMITEQVPSYAEFGLVIDAYRMAPAFQ